MPLALRPRSPRPAFQVRGFTLIELMISMVIALVLIIAMGIITTRFEVSKRQAGSSSDLSLNVGYMSYDMDRQLRSAGSGFTNNAVNMYGCQLMASLNGVQILPSPSAFPAPFSTVPTAVRMAPLLVHAGAGSGGSDVIQVMTASGGISEMASEIRLNSVHVNDLRLTSTLGFKGNDLIIVSEEGRNCMLSQIDTGYVGGPSQEMGLGGAYHAAVIGVNAITDFSTGAVANTVLIGNPNDNNPPRFLLMGVNDQQQLVSYDMLRNGGATTAVPLADGVMDFRVRYGVNNLATNNGIVTDWVLPSDAAWNVAALNAQTAASRTAAQRVLAIQVSMVIRSERIEDTDVAPATLTMFSGLPTALQSSYTVAARKQQHRVVEFTIPLRNTITAIGRPVP